MTQMTPEEQWALINTGAFFGAMSTKIKAVRTAMTSAEVEVDEVRTNVNNVPIKYNFFDSTIHIAVGEKNDKQPQVDLNIPSSWLGV